MSIELTADQRESEAQAADARGHHLLAARIRRGDDLKPRMLAEGVEGAAIRGKPANPKKAKP